MPQSKDDSLLYKSLFETSIDGIVIINDKGIMQDANEAVLALMGYNKEELVGQNVAMLMGAPHREKHDGYIDRYNKTREAKIIGIGREVDAMRKDGTIFPIRLAVSEFTREGATYFTGIIHDMSEEHEVKAKLNEYTQKLEHKVKKRTARLEKEVKLKIQAQKELLESQKLYEAIAENFPNGTIGVLDRDFNVLLMKGTELEGGEFDSDRLNGENYINLLPEDLRDDVKALLKEVLNGEHRVFEIKVGDKVFLGRSVPLANEEGVIDKILQVDLNITTEKQAEEEIYNALIKEKELNDLKSKFVSMASHEFRTPLSSIQSSATLIKRYAGQNEQNKREKHIGKITSNVKNLNLILNDFLSLEKIEGGLIKNKPQLFDLKEFVNEILEETSPLKKENQKIKLELNHKTKQVLLDPFLLRNVLNNLLSNAFKYSNDNGTITVKTDEKDDLQISIIDQGIGISEQDQVQLFGRFYRASNATNIQGTGLGLNIVKRYIQIMKGEVSFQSVLHEGSTFVISFNEYE
ncbi:MAG: PAS domain S-box protein [Bacteroidia bacterium]